MFFKMRHGMALAAGLLVLSWLVCMNTGLAQDFAEATPGEATRCPHELVEVRTTHEQVAYEQGDAQEHVREYDELTVMLCLDCGMELNRSSVPKSAGEAHAFDESGICTLCGAQKAGESAGETGEGVKPETPGELLESIGQAVDEGAGVRVDVVGAQDMLTQEEYEALKSLPAREQILVALAYVEWGAQAERALSSLDVPLSGQAASLMEQIAARLDALTPGERAAQQERLSQLFPAGEEEEADGTQRPYRSIDLRIDVDGTTYTQRYDLLLDETP